MLRHNAANADERAATYRAGGWSRYDDAADPNSGLGTAAGVGTTTAAGQMGTRTSACPRTDASLVGGPPDGTPGNPPGTMLSRGVDEVAGTNISGAHPENETRSSATARRMARPGNPPGHQGLARCGRRARHQHQRCAAAERRRAAAPATPRAGRHAGQPAGHQGFARRGRGAGHQHQRCASGERDARHHRLGSSAPDGTPGDRLAAGLAWRGRGRRHQYRAARIRRTGEGATGRNRARHATGRPADGRPAPPPGVSPDRRGSPPRAEAVTCGLASTAARASNRRARSTTGSSIMSPSKLTAPSPGPVAASKAATMRRARRPRLRPGAVFLVDDRHLGRMHAARAGEAEAAGPPQHGAVAVRVGNPGDGADEAERQDARRPGRDHREHLRHIQRIRRRLHAEIGGEVLAAGAERHQASVGPRDGLHGRKRRGGLDQADKAGAAMGTPCAASQSAVSSASSRTWSGPHQFGQHQRIGAGGDRGIDVEHRHADGPVDADADLGARLPDHRHRGGQGGAGGGFSAGRRRPPGRG